VWGQAVYEEYRDYCRRPAMNWPMAETSEAMRAAPGGAVQRRLKSVGGCGPWRGAGTYRCFTQGRWEGEQKALSLTCEMDYYVVLFKRHRHLIGM